MSELPEYWPDVPIELRSFYRELHDGFLNEIGAVPGGLERVANFCPLGKEGPDSSELIYLVRDDKGAKYELPEAQWPDLMKLIPVCRNPCFTLISTSRPHQTHASLNTKGNPIPDAVCTFACFLPRGVVLSGRGADGQVASLGDDPADWLFGIARSSSAN